jgi:hypothetical protein
MDQKPDVIRGQIEEHRQELVENVRELETRVKSMADWRMRFQQDPGKMLGIAFAGGVVLSWLTRGHNGQVRNCSCYGED